MNGFLLASLVLLCGVAPLGWIVYRHPPIDGLVAFELASIMVTSLLVLLCEAFQQPSFVDLALALAVLSFAGGLVYARFLERWV